MEASNGKDVKKRRKDQEAPERVWALRLLWDICGNNSKVTIIVIGIITIMLFYWWSTVDYCTEQKFNLCKDILDCCSCGLGFAIAGYSIILTLDSKIVSKLNVSFADKDHFLQKLLFSKSNLYDILCASFALCCIFLLLTIISVIWYKNAPDMINNDWMFSVIQILSIISVSLIVDLILHLYAVSTFLNGNHHKVKLCQKNKNELR